MGWSDLPSDPVISIAIRLPDPGDFARFRGVCRSWKSALRGFRPTFFPWLAVINCNTRPGRKSVSFISHASNNCRYKLRVPLPISGRTNADLDCSNFRANKDGWMLFMLNDLVPILVNPLTGAHNLHPFPCIYTLRGPWKGFNCDFFLPDILVTFVECRVEEDRHILAAAKPGDAEWSVLHHFSLTCYREAFIMSIVFHEADGKVYAMNCEGEMQSFRVSRAPCDAGLSKKKIVFAEVSSILAKATTKQVNLVVSFLVSDGTSLLQVRKIVKSMEFEILKYCPDADMWVKTMNYLGDKSLFFDSFGARLLPLPFSFSSQGDTKDTRRPRRNCFYFTDICDKFPPPRPHPPEEHRYVHRVRIYDAGKGTVEPCFDTRIYSYHSLLPGLMWFTPSQSLNS